MTLIIPKPALTSFRGVMFTTCKAGATKQHVKQFLRTFDTKFYIRGPSKFHTSNLFTLIPRHSCSKPSTLLQRYSRANPCTLLQIHCCTNWSSMLSDSMFFGKNSLRQFTALNSSSHSNSISDSIRRGYHARSRLTIEDNVYMAYLQSLVQELETTKGETLNMHQSFPSEREERMHIDRQQFLLGANHVISRIMEKQSEIAELKNLTSDEKDQDMKEMMLCEVEALRQDIQVLEDELIDVLAGDEPADNNDIILEVSSGVGGQEAMLFGAELFHMYCQYGMGQGWNVTLVDKDENELGGIRKASVEISGLEVYRWLKHEAGVHRVQRVPKTEKGGRVHTSTVSVSILPQPREIDVQIEKKDLKIETFRNSGPGGQSVNTTDSAVRITHLPTGTVAECKQERSQIKNKEKAMKILKMRLYQAQLEEEEGNRRATRKMQIGSRGRSEKIRTYNYQQDRVTDHRVKENFSNLLDFMAGGEGMEDLISSLEKDFKCRIVESMVDQFEYSSRSTAKKL